MDKVKKTQSFSVEQSSIVEYSNSTLSKIMFYIVRDGNNAHNMPITLNAIEMAKKTLAGKPVLANYNPYRDDFEGHEDSEIPVGYFVEDDMEIVEMEGRKWLKAYAYIWKQYFPHVMNVFKKKDGNTDVSMEIDILDLKEDESGESNGIIDAFSFAGVTLLGVAPAIKGARAEVQRYSFAEMKSVLYGTKIYEIPSEVKENANMSLELSKSLRRKNLGSQFIFMSRELSEHTHLEREHVEAIYEYLSENFEDGKAKGNTNKYISFNGLGGYEALDWCKSIIEGDEIGDLNSDLNIDQKDFQDTSNENSGDDKNNDSHGKELVGFMKDEKMMKDMMMKVMEEMMADDMMEGYMKDMAKDMMEDKDKMESMYGEIMGMMPADMEEMPEESMMKDMMMEVMGKMAEVQRVDKGDNNDGVYMSEEAKADYEKVCAEKESLEKEKVEYEAKIAEYEEEISKLKKFKTDTETELFEEKVAEVLAGAKEVVSEEVYSELETKSKDFSYENFEAYEQFVESRCYRALIAKKEDDANKINYSLAEIEKDEKNKQVLEDWDDIKLEK